MIFKYWDVTNIDGKYVVSNGVESYSFDTLWAANIMSKFCKNTDPYYKNNSVVINNGLIFSNFNNASTRTVFSVDNHKVIEIDQQTGSVIKFDLPYMVYLWIKTTKIYNVCSKLKTIPKKLWCGGW